MRPARLARAIAAVAVAVTLLVVGSGPAQPKTYFVPVTGSLVVHGFGYGHGHGMSQYGAQGAALAGRSYRQILNYYYPHTRLVRRKGPIRVLITADKSPAVVVMPARGLSVRDPAGDKSWTLPNPARIDRWRLKPMKGKPSRTVVAYQAGDHWHRWNVPGRGSFAGDAQFDADRAIGLVLPDSTVLRYHGALRAAVPDSGSRSRDTVNVVSLDDYVRGVIAAEMPASWAQPALRAQAVAARTYGTYLRRANVGHYYQICDTTACQVYGGASAQARSTNTAVNKTARRILTYRGEPALTQFSASSGGWTSAGGQPYLPARKDRYDGWPGNGVHRWSVRISTGELESAYPQLGRLQAIRVTEREGHGKWGGRVSQLSLEGSEASVRLTGDEFRWLYGLRSTWFSVEPTPIIAAWRHLGGRTSPLGAPKSPEQPVSASHAPLGARQTFAHGRFYWSRPTGALPLRGPILHRYRYAGGPVSRYGFPMTNVMPTAGGGSKARFQRGMFFHSAATGPRPVYGRILDAYARRHYSAGRLGYPVTSVRKTDHGLRSRFQHGTISWQRQTDKIKVVVR